MHFPPLDRTVRRAFNALCVNVNTPIALKAQACLNSSDWVGLTTIEVDISGYSCPRLLSGDLQIAAFFKKYPGFDLGIDLEAKAIDSFWQSERQCFRSNRYLTPLLDDPVIYGSGVCDLLGRARKEVRRILGPLPCVDKLEPRFGPGSTYLDVGPLTTVPDKMSDSYTLTQSARFLLEPWDKTAWSRHAASSQPFQSNDDPDCDIDDDHAPRIETIVRGNRFTTVEKDAWKRRGICIEPSINLFYQLGVGEWLTKRLLRTCRWDKDNIQEHHKLLAKQASLDGLHATIDLSNASDTVCEALVRLLLPEDWFNFLDKIRSHHTRVGGRWVKLEKFSSMGNGFTFELETIVFRAIVVASQKEAFTFRGEWFGGEVSVFGDDIICPTSSTQDVMAALTFFGFETNKKKTFLDGSFRESCGGDYFKGHDVRPHYLKEIINEPHQYIALANGLRRFGIRHILCGGPDVYRFPRLVILGQLPKQIRDLTGPERLGDLVVCDEEHTWRTTVRSSIRYIRVWRPVAFERTPWAHFRPGVVLASALYGVSDGSPRGVKSEPVSIGSQELRRETSDGILSRFGGEYVKGYRFGRVAFS